MKNENCPYCPSCDILLDSTHILYPLKDAYDEDVLLTASCKYCSKCLYVANEHMRFSK